MARLYLDSRPVYNVVMPSIRKGINHLNKALNYLNSSSAPSGYGNDLSNKKDKVIQIKKELTRLEDWLEDSMKQLDNKENSMIEKASGLPKEDIPLRKNKIN